MKLAKLLFTALLLLKTMTAFSAVQQFGTLIAGSFTPSSTFASLSVQGSGNTYDFTLTANDLNALFNNGAFISRLAIDTAAGFDLKGKDATTLTISNISGGVTNVSAANSGGPTNRWDFSFALGQGAGDRLTANESVTWRASFSENVAFTGYALHVQGLTAALGNSGWYASSVTSPVAEPNMMMIFVSGVLFMGVARRYKNSH